LDKCVGATIDVVASTLTLGDFNAGPGATPDDQRQRRRSHARGGFSLADSALHTAGYAITITGTSTTPSSTLSLDSSKGTWTLSGGR